MPWLINSTQLEKFRKSQKNLLIFDASCHMENENRNAKQEFLAKHIAGAHFFDIDVFSDPHSELPHTLIHDEAEISKKLGELGIRNDYKIIFYDHSHLHSACRALWMMKVFGHNPHLLYILDGGLNAWEKYGGKIDAGDTRIVPKSYHAKFQPNYIRTLTQIKQNLHEPAEQIIDVRHPVRFAGGPESRSHMRQGHIPGSYSFPYFSFFEKNGTFRSKEKLRSLLTNLAVDLKSPVIASCGSGVTAPILDFVLELIGHAKHSVYDGSWSEWGANKLYPGEKTMDERPVEDCLKDYGEDETKA